MSVPPPPQGPWQTPHGQPTQGQPYGPPPGQYPGWPPPGPPKKNNALKWALGLVGLIAVIAVAVAVTVVVLHSDSNGSANNGGAGSDSPSDIASAKDTGPVAIITDEPTCDKFQTINNGIANQEQDTWHDRDISVPATAWSPDLRARYEAVAAAMRNAADQTVALAKQTPHRVVRELYEQAIAYWRAFAESVPTYTDVDNRLSIVATDAAWAVRDVCEAISAGSAGAQAHSVTAAAPPSHPAVPGDPTQPQRFLKSRDPVCGDWVAVVTKYEADTADWAKIDRQLSANQWTPEQKASIDGVKPVMSGFSDNIEKLGRRSDNPTLQDFAVLSSQYRRAYVEALSSYVPSDSYLSDTAFYAAGLIGQACLAVGG